MKRAINIILIMFLMAQLTVADSNELEAEEIYMQTCYVCHGDDGSGNMPGVPGFSDNKTLYTDNEADIIARLKKGIQTPGNVSMPPSGGNQALTDVQLLNVLRYIKNIVK